MLNDTTIQDFNNLLASDAPAPGGGSAAALMGAMGVCLVEMVATLTAKKSSYASRHTLMAQVQEETQRLRLELLNLIDEDTEAFKLMGPAYALPANSEQNILIRNTAIQEAHHACIESPYRMMNAALLALRLAQRVSTGYNTNTASDLGVAALGLGAAIRGAWLNILINLDGITDVDYADQYRSAGEALLAEAMPLVESVYQDVIETITKRS